jgi:Kef-type K+ transport system membrane component KefB
VPQLALLIAQLGVVLVAARLAGWLFRRINQPQVVGEMVAGIMLGPSLLGWVAPGVSEALFPPQSLGFLNSLSQIGLLIFMFLVGVELNPRLLRSAGRTALITSHAGIVVPFLLGAALAPALHQRFAEDGVGLTGFALFMGTAMSVTAFPVLARILHERGLLQTRVGVVAIACAAVGDATAWCILAAVVVLTRAGGDSGTGLPLWAMLAGAGGYVVAMLLGVRRILKRLGTAYHRRGQLTQDMLTLVLLLALASALITEWLGLHALFGAFLAGIVLPKDQAFVEALTAKLTDLTVVLFLPLFFAFTGLRTTFELVSGGTLWLYGGLVILVAVVGKVGGSTLAARFTGMDWRRAGTVGVLMNTRGLMELVILNVGLDLGLLSPPLFAIMVLMAVVTTLMTSPLLEWIYPARLIHAELHDAGAQPRPRRAEAAHMKGIAAQSER